ncbi:ABC transporter substrate-binding protein [Halomonas llamarensis]|uniref:ABC transporter substrate-binding protein n=1 Tax=Halomonas llamarensis TaxID=2945104 RepID=A0ABT0SV70_9GAMM|nr:ABC transporter substrate-binding protein [Halomonas llamarensis]MCL7931666.1 ABC transporter substrate-binding protein [Halomonas llamarensis]
MVFNYENIHKSQNMIIFYKYARKLLKYISSIAKVAIFFVSFSVFGEKNSDIGTIATLDHAVGETLFEILDSPVAMGSVSSYRKWVGENSIPKDLVNIGITYQPNKELLSKLDITSILIPLQFTYLEKSLSTIAPVKQLSPYNVSSISGWKKIINFTKEVGLYSDRKNEAELMISEAEEELFEIRERAGSISSPLLIVQFLGKKHVRVYADNSMPGIVLDRLGLQNAWKGKSNRWGFSIVSISELFDYDDHLVIIDTSHLTGQKILQEGVMLSDIWSRLPSVQKNNFTLLNADFWVFGALPSAIRFADSLVNVLNPPHSSRRW